ncbi:MAG: recombinase family protein [Armatimonadota bacterium]
MESSPVSFDPVSTETSVTSARPHRYVLYARKSSEEKTKQVQSIEDQIHALDPLREQGGYNVVATLTESRSAKAPGRPVFNEMLDLINKGEADAILCWHLNRLSRNEIDSGTIRWLLRQGVIKEIVTPHRTYRPEDNALITAVESAMGEQFIVELTASSRRGMLSKVEKGWFPSRAPQGYKNDVTARTIVRDPQCWDLIRQAWREVASGEASIPQVGENLREAGHPVARASLYHLFSNVFYTGVFEFQGKRYPGKHEPMVTLAEFQAVQRLLGRGDDALPLRRQRKHRFTFSGLIRCGHCGAGVCADRKRKVIKDTGEERFYTYYACSRGSGCPGSGRVREDHIEAAVANWLAEVSLPEPYLDFARDVARRHRAEERQAEEAVRASQARALTQTEQKLDELLSLRLERLIDDGEYAQRKNQILGERNAVLNNSQKATEAIERSWEIAEAVATFCTTAEREFAEGDLVEKGRILRQLGASYQLVRGEIIVELNGLLGLVREHNEKTAVLPALLEPLEIGSGSREYGGFDPVSLGWGSLLDAIRTKSVKEFSQYS